MARDYVKEAGLHGGFVRDRGVGPQVSNPDADELKQVDPAGVISPRLAGHGAKARKTKLAVMGLSADLLDAGDPRYASCVRLGNAFRKARTKEMYELHGHVGSGVSALLAASAMALASSRFLYEVAASADQDVRPDLLTKASKLSDSARQNELSAWELCVREGVVRRRNDSNSVQLPWVTGDQLDTKKGRGRPRKVQVLASENAQHVLQNSTSDNDREAQGPSDESDGEVGNDGSEGS